MATREIDFPFIDPVILDLPGRFDVRWYGLGYVIGFVLAYTILAKLSRAKRFPYSVEETGNLLTWLIIGVIGGGRIGYALFYSKNLMENPLSIFAVWQGGLSFHGGLLGVVLVGVIMSRRYRRPLWASADGFALAVTPGIFLVRVANFIKGELYGRVVGPNAWFGMRFPTDDVATRAIGASPRLSIRDQELAILNASENGTWERVKESVPLRHPSQLYEAFAEGIALGLILFVLYRVLLKSKWRIGNGFIFGVFLSGYGLFRFLIEYCRQPDSQFSEGPHDPGYVLGPLTMGQVLCTLMFLIGAAIVIRALKNPDEGGKAGSITHQEEAQGAAA